MIRISIPLSPLILLPPIIHLLILLSTIMRSIWFLVCFSGDTHVCLCMFFGVGSTTYYHMLGYKFILHSLLILYHCHLTFYGSKLLLLIVELKISFWLFLTLKSSSNNLTLLLDNISHTVSFIKFIFNGLILIFSWCIIVVYNQVIPFTLIF